jgi:alcohol dehydrogenase class IV
VMVPTTAGTGAEVTRWATLWDVEANRKRSLEGPETYPLHAVLDPALTLSLPPAVTAVTGADALAHAMEAYWNRNAGPVTDVYALEAVRRIVEILPLAVSEPGNLEYRARMLLASLLAGLAMSGTKTAAAHSLSYPMTLRFGVAHGQAAAVTLPALLRYNAAAFPERMARLAQAAGGSDVESGARRLRDLLQRIGLKVSLSELGIDADGIEILAREGYTPERAGNNLRELDPEGLREVLRASL